MAIRKLKDTDFDDYSKMSLEELQARQQELKDSMESQAKKLKTKKYNVLITKPRVGQLIKYLREDVHWTWMEAYGVRKLVEDLTTAYKSMKQDAKGVKMDTNMMEAVMYFFMKHEGWGYSEATKFISNVIEPIGVKISEKLDKAKEDVDGFEQYKQHIQVIDQRIIAKMEGIDLDAEVEEMTGGGKKLPEDAGQDLGPVEDEPDELEESEESEEEPTEEEPTEDTDK